MRIDERSTPKPPPPRKDPPPPPPRKDPAPPPPVQEVPSRREPVGRSLDVEA